MRSANEVVVELVMREMLAGDDSIAETLRTQWAACTVRIEPSSGLFVYFHVPPEIPRLVNEDRTAGDVTLILEGLDAPMGSVLSVREGAIHLLDIRLYGNGPWPREPRVKEVLVSLGWVEATAKARARR